VQKGMRSGCCRCCSGQSAASQRPCSHLGHTATLLASCTNLQRCRSLHLPVLHSRNCDR
jgi:hypothetical protein